MTLRRTITSGGAIASLLLLAAAPAPAGGDTTSHGTATTTSVPLLVEAGGETVELGRTVLTATTDDGVVADAPWSAVGLTLVDVAGTALGEVAVTSDGTTTSPGAVIGEDTAAGAVSATAASLLAVADDAAGSATAALTSLSTEATVLEALGLTATISGVVATVDDTGAAAGHSLALADIDLDLAHVLGEVLNTLPLADLLVLADQLGIEVPNIDAATDVATATQALVDAVADAATSSTVVSDAVDALLLADGGTYATLQGLLTDLSTIGDDPDLAAAVIALATLLTDPLLLDCEVTPTLGTLEADLLAVEACLTAAVDAHLLALGGVADALETAVGNYLADVAAAAAAATTLEGITESIGGLLGDLLGANLLDLGGIDVTQQVRAVGGQPDASSASTTCALTTMSVLGGDAIELADCDGSGTPALDAVELVTTTLQALLDTVGGVDTDGALVQLDLFRTTQDTVTADGNTVRATSVLEVLALTVPDITIDACDVELVGDLACALGVVDAGILDTALGTVDEVLTTAQTTVTTALTLADELVTALGLDLDTSAADGVQAVVDTALGALLAVIAPLDDGVGLAVPGVRVVVDPELVAEHTVVAAAGGTPDPAPNPAPTPGGTPLPNTGGGAALTAIAALGAGAWLWRRRED